MGKYNLEQFIEKYKNKRHISCGINYVNGEHDTMMNVSCLQIISYIKATGKEVTFIVSR